MKANRMFFMKNIKIFVVLFFLSRVYLFAQSRPFPQNVDYPYGYQTSVITASNVQTAYNRWKSKFLKKCNGMLRVVCDDNDTTITISEGMGYGMLLTAYFGEKGKFDSLFAFYKNKRTTQAYNLMGWKVTCGGFLDRGSATDGDLDVAFALIIAHYQWGGDYLTEADSLLTILKDHYFVTCGSGIYTMKPGGQFGGCELTDVSYYTPAYFKVFAEETNDPFWDAVAEDAYTILYNGADYETGLVRDWQSYDGGDPPSGWTNYYRYDASRIPWRMALDYLWNGDANAQDWCAKISDFANSVGASNIVDGYDLDGTARGQYNNSSFVGGFAVGGMCYSQSMVNSFASRLLYLDGCGYDDQYFNFSLRCLYMLVLTGNFWKPEPTPGVKETESLSEKFYLKQNYPNPFRTTTTIEYSIAESSFVQLRIYDIAGREISTLINEKIPEGRYTFNFYANGLSPGVYFYRIKAGEFLSEPFQMILIK
jgi:endo-1,4-beta-D-glucanase Y